jgi:hypothetical protein
MSNDEEEFKTITSRFDLEDWRTVRNEDYWKSDEIYSQVERLRYKLVRLRHYDKYGTTIEIEE